MNASRIIHPLVKLGPAARHTFVLRPAVLTPYPPSTILSPLPSPTRPSASSPNDARRRRCAKSHPCLPGNLGPYPAYGMRVVCAGVGSPPCRVVRQAPGPVLRSSAPPRFARIPNSCLFRRALRCFGAPRTLSAAAGGAGSHRPHIPMNVRGAAFEVRTHPPSYIFAISRVDLSSAIASNAKSHSTFIQVRLIATILRNADSPSTFHLLPARHHRFLSTRRPRMAAFFPTRNTSSEFSGIPSRRGTQRRRAGLHLKARCLPDSRSFPRRVGIVPQ